MTQTPLSTAGTVDSTYIFMADNAVATAAQIAQGRVFVYNSAGVVPTIDTTVLTANGQNLTVITNDNQQTVSYYRDGAGMIQTITFSADVPIGFGVTLPDPATTTFKWYWLHSQPGINESHNGGWELTSSVPKQWTQRLTQASGTSNFAHGTVLPDLTTARQNGVNSFFLYDQATAMDNGFWVLPDAPAPAWVQKN